MRRKWNNHELVEHWTLDDKDRRLIYQKRGANRLGFALLLKSFQLKGRFPEKKSEISRVVRTFVAAPSSKIAKLPVATKTVSSGPNSSLRSTIPCGKSSP